MVDLFGAAADTLWFIQLCDVNFMVEMEERSQINLSPYPSLHFLFFTELKFKHYKVQNKQGEVSSAFVENETGGKDRDWNFTRWVFLCI